MSILAHVNVGVPDEGYKGARASFNVPVSEAGDVSVHAQGLKWAKRENWHDY